MHYDYTMLWTFVSTLFSGLRVGEHAARVTATATLLQGLLLLKQATLSGMGRGAALLDTDKQFMSQLKRAHRLMKNAAWEAWDVGSALYGQMTAGLASVVISVDWTTVGRFMVLEASLVVGGRGIPFYAIAVLTEEWKGRQTTIELSMWYALAAMRRDGQTLYVVVDRGFAKMDWIGPSELYPYIHLLVRLKRSMILTWGTVSGALGEWPLYPGEVVMIEQATLGRREPEETGFCLAHLRTADTPWYLACAPSDVGVALAQYGKRAWVEEQNRDLKTGFVLRVLRLLRADRLERMWTLLGLAFYVSYCNEAVGDSAFAQRLSRRYKDGRKDLSWLALAKCAELAGRYDVLFRPLAVQ